MNKLPQGSADEFLLINRPKRKNKKSMVVDSSKAQKGVKSSYQLASLSPEQKQKIKDYKDQKGRIL
tara:strand:+ start:31335 stop:31532 length:198 start_codon:yes stop_codon:yes gene_type:complete